MEKRYLTKDGRVVWGALTVTRLPLSEVFPGRNLIHLRDVTEQHQAEEALRASEERFRALVEATSDWIWEVDAEGRYTYASPKVKELLGYEPQEVLGRSPFELMPPEEAGRVAEVVRPCLEQGLPFAHVENTNLHKDGHLVVLDTSGVPVFDGQGLLQGFRGIDRDITEQKRAQEALAESESLFRALVEQSMDGVALADLKTKRVIKANPRMCQLLGYSEAELVGLNVWDVHPEEARAEVMETFGAQARGELTVPAELPMLRKDGSVFLAEVGAKPITVGDQIWMLGVFRDVTERKRAEAALRESEARYRQFLQVSLQGIWRFDITPPVPIDLDERTQAELLLERVRVAECNEVIAQRYGFASPEDVAGARLEDLWTADRETKLSAITQFIRSGYRVSNLETTGHGRDGSKGWFLNSVTGIIVDGKLGAAWGTYLDITKRRRAEQALQESEARYRQFLQVSVEGIWRLECPPIATSLDEREQAELMLQGARVAECNEAMARRFGYARAEDMVGVRIADLWQASHEAQVAALLQFVRSGYRISDLEVEGAYPDGSRGHFLINLVGLVQDGYIAVAWGTERDITERKRGEQAVRESEARYRQFLQISVEGIWRLELDEPVPVDLEEREQAELILAGLRIAECNDAIATQFGLSQEELVGRRLDEVWQMSHGLKVAAILQYVRSGYRLVNVENQGYMPAGAPKWVLTNATGIIRDGYLTGGWTTHVDITERKEAEHALKESEARYRQFLNMSVEGIWRLECDPPIPVDLEEREQVELMLTRTRVAECNEAMAVLFGLRPEDLVGASLDQVWHIEHTVKVAAGLHFLRSGYRLVDVENAGYLPDGTLRWVRSNVTGVVEDGYLRGGWGTHLDITDRKTRGGGARTFRSPPARPLRGHERRHSRPRRGRTLPRNRSHQTRPALPAGRGVAGPDGPRSLPSGAGRVLHGSHRPHAGNR